MFFVRLLGDLSNGCVGHLDISDTGGLFTIQKMIDWACRQHMSSSAISPENKEVEKIGHSFTSSAAALMKNYGTEFCHLRCSLQISWSHTGRCVRKLAGASEPFLWALAFITFFSIKGTQRSRTFQSHPAPLVAGKSISARLVFNWGNWKRKKQVVHKRLVMFILCCCCRASKADLVTSSSHRAGLTQLSQVQ